jgi:hypothetical protein
MFALMLAATVLAPHSTSSECTRQHPPSAVQLRRIAQQLHPEMFAASSAQPENVIALVLDRRCRVQYHALSVQTAIPSVDSTLATIFPEAHLGRTEVGGITLENRTTGRPVILWGVPREP